MDKPYLSSLLVKAIKNRNSNAQQALRAVISEIDLAQAKHNLSQDQIFSIIKKERDKFIECANIFREKQPYTADVYMGCSDVLSALIPSQIPESEYSQIIKDSGCKDIGGIMKYVKIAYGPKLDMKSFSTFVKANI